MKGSFRKRGKSWYYTIDIGKDPATGKRNQKTKGGFRTKKEAQEAAAELINQMSKGFRVPTKEQKLNKYLYDWLELHAKQKVKSTTFKNYKRAIDSRIIPIIGELALNEITPAHGQYLIKNLIDAGLSKRYIEYIFVVLYGALEQAVKWELIHKNPFKYVEVPRSRRGSEKIKTWSQEEVNRFLHFGKFENPTYYTLFLLTIYTGMRRGEVLGLTWDNVNLDECKIYINHSLIYDDEGYRLSEPKTESSKRQISIDDYVAKELKRYRKQQNEFKLLLGPDFNKQNFVFTSERGNPVYPRSMTTQFNRFIKKANVPKIRFHDLRHTHATLLLKIGTNPKIVSERLGHSSIRMTLDIYSHVTLDMQENTAHLFGESLRNNNQLNVDKM